MRKILYNSVLAFFIIFAFKIICKDNEKYTLVNASSLNEGKKEDSKVSPEI